MKAKSIDPVVFFSSSLFIIGFILLGLFYPVSFEQYTRASLNFCIQRFGWFYLILTLSFLVFCIYLLFSPYKDIKLGKDDEKPAYSNLTWLAMLFSAGMGIGLLFYGVAEPITHYANPPMNLAEPMSPDSARLAFRYSFFHWGLHPWAVYSVLSLSIAFFQFRKKESGLISSSLKPILPNYKILLDIIDSLAIVATVFGVATSLGLGSLQIHSGLTFLFGIDSSVTNTILIIIITSIAFMISASTGLDKGIKILSNLNLGLAFLLWLFVLIVGPTVFILEVITTTIGGFIQNFIPMSFRMTPFTKSQWLANNTLFYWAWWIAWAPFVGTFIARISRGRTIQEFLLGVLFVPTLLGCLWFSVFGGNALYEQMFLSANIVDAVKTNEATAIFVSLQNLPLGSFLNMTAVILLLVFFVTSADSATFVLGMFSSKGISNPSTSVKLVWGCLVSGIAILLISKGGIEPLKTVSIIISLPFAFIMLGVIVSLYKSLKKENVASQTFRNTL
jgi:glycine betaine transporter